MRMRRLCPSDTSVLTEVAESLLDLLSGQVDVCVRRDERSVQPVVVLIAVHAVSPQLVYRELLLQQADDLHLRELGAVTHICTQTWERKKARY